MEGYALRGGHPKTGQFTVPTGTATLIATVPAGGQGAYGGGLKVMALPSNTATIYIGPLGITTTTGFPMVAGNIVFLPIDDPSRLAAVSGTAGQGLAWIGV
jgi:hypothetical protein